MRQQIATLCSVLLLAGGCTTTVNLSVMNQAPQALDVRIKIRDKNGLERPSIPLGALQSNASISFTLKVSPETQLGIASSIPGGYDYADAPYRTIAKKPDPLDLPITLKEPSGVSHLDPRDPNTINQISRTFSALGRNLGFKPSQVRDALSNSFGALAVLSPPVGPGQGGVVHLLLPPRRFSGYETTLEELHYFDSLAQNKVRTLSSTVQGLAVSVPLIGDLGLNYTSESLYELDWTLQGYGPIERHERNGWDFLTGLNALSDDLRSNIRDLLAANPTARIYYINRMYAVKLATFRVKEARKLGIGDKLSAGTFVTAGGAWSFENSQEQVQLFTELVLNMEGTEVPVSFSMVTHREPIYPSGDFIAPPPPIGYRDVQRLEAQPVQRPPTTLAVTGALQSALGASQ